jgi:23S rRNA pseudouridine955/2504/2580 synthase
MDTTNVTLTACPDDAGRRLDRVLRKALPALPLSAVYRMTRQGRVLVNGKRSRPDTRLAAGDIITIAAFTDGQSKVRSPAGGEENLAGLSIIYEGGGLLVLDKPAGLATHGHSSLETQTRRYLEPRLSPSLSFRPGPLNRLDRGTSGLVVFSTSLEGAQAFTQALRERRVHKYYLALLQGTLDHEETWEDRLLTDGAHGGNAPKTLAAPDGKRALTLVKPMERRDGETLALVEIRTGRTHQIRAQAAAHGHPLVGDVRYGGRARDNGFFLRAWRLVLPDDFPLAVPRMFEAPLLPEVYKMVNDAQNKEREQADRNEGRHKERHNHYAGTR